jgi:RNA ligase (TIGR02306 family)
MRKLASLQTVKHVRPIPGADNIEAVGVLGWQCVAKKGEFRAGDPCVYFEIDSLLPDQPRYEFLRQSSFKPDLGKFKLRTVRLRKQLSQGLALPVGLFPEAACLPIGADLTALLGVEQYEPPIPTFIAGDTRTFRWSIPKTDEIRVQQDDEHSFLAALGVPFVPVLERGDSFPYSLADLLEKAKGRYRDHFPGAKEAQEREGIVVRSLCGSISFKAINNDFLLAEQ